MSVTDENTRDGNSKGMSDEFESKEQAAKGAMKETFNPWKSGRPGNTHELPMDDREIPAFSQEIPAFSQEIPAAIFSWFQLI